MHAKLEVSETRKSRITRLERVYHAVGCPVPAFRSDGAFSGHPPLRPERKYGSLVCRTAVLGASVQRA